MAGIYIHIPFCRQACHYCNFHFTTSLNYQNELVAALLKEIDIQQNYLPNAPIDTIYFGGGTPSLLSITDLHSILKKLRNTFSLNADAEITLESNPDDISTAQLIQWQEAGINRLSIGIQSFFEEDLRWMNRAHSASQATSALQEARKIFDNITVDLIYGSPGLTNQKWKENVDRLVKEAVPHLSCYALTVEPKTPLDKMIRQGLTSTVDPDKQAEQLLLLMDWLEAAGYDHYEISNFGKPGFHSRHNSSYWQGKPYLGIGPSAHSYNGQSRQWNISNNQRYIKSIQEHQIPFELEILTPAQQLNEYIMISLRTMEGIHLPTLESKFGDHESARILEESRKYLSDKKMEHISSGHLKLTRQGKLLADGIAADLFVP